MYTLRGSCSRVRRAVAAAAVAVAAAATEAAEAAAVTGPQTLPYMTLNMVMPSFSTTPRILALSMKRSLLRVAWRIAIASEVVSDSGF